MAGILKNFTLKSKHKSNHFVFIFYRPDYTGTTSILLIDLLKRMLTKNPEERASIYDVLSHDWVTSNGIDPVSIKNTSSIKIDDSDKLGAIGKVNLFQVIKIKFKQRMKEMVEAAAN